MHRAPEAWEYYQEGFDLGPNDLSLIALALQCLYDEKDLLPHEDALRALAAKHEGSWIAYLATDTLANHEKNKGVDPKYRPRGYNEGPRRSSGAEGAGSRIARRVRSFALRFGDKRASACCTPGDVSATARSRRVHA